MNSGKYYNICRSPLKVSRFASFHEFFPFVNGTKKLFGMQMNQDGRPVDRTRLDTSSLECSTSSVPFAPSFREHQSTDPVDVALPTIHYNDYVEKSIVTIIVETLQDKLSSLPCIYKQEVT